MPDMTRETLVKTLEDIALLLELKGENPFKTRAYRNGAEVIQNFDGDIVDLAAKNELKGIKGIGDALQQKLRFPSTLCQRPAMMTPDGGGAPVSLNRACTSSRVSGKYSYEM